MGQRTPNPNLDEQSDEIAAAADAIRKKGVSGATQVIYLNLENAANRISTLVDAPVLDEDEARTAQIQLKAATQLLTFGGLKVDKVEHSGEVQFQPIEFSVEGEAK